MIVHLFHLNIGLFRSLGPKVISQTVQNIFYKCDEAYGADK